MSGLITDGFVIMQGPVPAADMVALRDAYDVAVANSSSADVHHGSTSIRINGFVNRDACFDPIYVHDQLLIAAKEVIGANFTLSAFHGRSLRPHAVAQPLHQDISPFGDGWPMLGFIFMVDAFEAENGATRFVSGSQYLTEVPADLVEGDARLSVACGSAGSMVLFNGSVWHGHGPNLTSAPRRSIQGALIRYDVKSAADHASRIRLEVVQRLSPAAQALLGLKGS